MSWGMKLLNAAGSAFADVDGTFKALRVTLRPCELIGYYSVGSPSGLVTGVAANGPVFSFRNTGANPMLVRRVSLGFVVTTAFTTAQALAYALIKASSFTVSDSGGTALYTAGANKHRGSFTNIASAPDIRIASTAALTAGTRTLEAAPLNVIGGSAQAVGASLPPQQLLEQDPGDYPLLLAQNEGFVITNLIAMGAAGVINLHVGIEYAEASSY